MRGFLHFGNIFYIRLLYTIDDRSTEGHLTYIV
jgi:hypothetical protein